MPHSTRLTLPLTALLAILFTVGSLPAADADPGKTAAKLMLEKGWDNDKAARDVVNKQDLSKPPLKDDPRVRAAHWLALMYQGRRGLALDSLRVFLEKHPTSLDPLRAEVWMRMADKDYEQAIATAQRLADVIAPAQQGGAQAAPAATASDELVQFLGHVAGFLEGPANKANDAERQKFEAQLLARLSDAQKKQFQSAKQDVLDQFRGMQKQAANFKQEAQQAANPAPQVNPGKLNDKSEQLAKDKAKVDADAKKVADDLQSKIANLERQDAPLQLEWRNLKNQSAQLNNTIQQQESELKRLEQNAADAKNPQQQQARIQAGQVQNQLRELKPRLTFVTNEIFRVEAAHQRLVQQGLMGQWQFQNEGQKVQGQQKQLDQEMRKNAADQRRTEQHAKEAAAADTRALENKAATLQKEALSFATYDLFPFEELRAKLLRSLR